MTYLSSSNCKSEAYGHGKENGLLKDFHVQELAAPLLKQLSAGIEHEIDDVILGNVVGPGGNVARLSALEADLPFLSGNDH